MHDALLPQQRGHRPRAVAAELREPSEFLRHDMAVQEGATLSVGELHAPQEGLVTRLAPQGIPFGIFEAHQLGLALFVRLFQPIES